MMKDGFSEGLELLQDALKEAERLWDDDCEHLWTALNEKEQQAMFYSVIKRVYKYRVLDELSYRGVLYDGFGFDQSSYRMGMACNFLDLHNMLYDAEQFEAQKESLEKLYEFTRYIANDWVESSYEKVRVQRDDYIRMAKKLLEELENE
jgi:hypothetical protein